jgi:hypothetical protein
MDPSPVEVRGTLQADGTVVLDQKPALPPGRVRVTLQALPYSPADDPFWQGMQAIWDAQKARGHVPRTKEEIDAELRELDKDAEAEMQAAERLYEECRRAREQAAGSGDQAP